MHVSHFALCGNAPTYHGVSHFFSLEDAVPAGSKWLLTATITQNQGEAFWSFSFLKFLIFSLAQVLRKMTESFLYLSHSTMSSGSVFLGLVSSLHGGGWTYICGYSDGLSQQTMFFFKILSQTVMLTIGARLFLTDWYLRVWKYQPSSSDVWSCCLHTEISSLNLLMRSLSHTGEPLPIFYLWDACFIPNPVTNLLPVICSTRWCILAFHNSVPNCRGEW